jgi:3-deoxy-7-phosphoheptulonate synthase
MSKASIAAGADGLILEVHHDPDNSMTGDGVQSLFPDQFDELMIDLRKLATAIGRSLI